MSKPVWSPTPDAVAATAMRRAMFWGTVPSRSLEFLMLVLFVAIVLAALSAGGSLVNEIPTIAVYFIGIGRVLPTLSLLGNARMQNRTHAHRARLQRNV